MSRKPTAPPIDLDALAAKLAPMILSRLATALGATEAPYSTRRGYEPPEYQGRPKKWKADAPTIPGAVLVGRWWSVSRTAYAAWLASKRTTPIAKVANDSATSEPWSPRAALESVGLRGSR